MSDDPIQPGLIILPPPVGVGLVVNGTTVELDEPLRSIAVERNRQKSLPGSEWDLNNSPNDWIAIVNRYLGESARCAGNKPAEEDYRDSLIKAAAVILAALDHLPRMSSAGHFNTP